MGFVPRSGTVVLARRYTSVLSFSCLQLLEEDFLMAWYSSSMSKTRLPHLSLLVVALFTAPLLAIWAERTVPTVWQQSLLEPFFFESEVDRHTPLISEGTYLPPRITKDTTLNEGPILIAHDTQIEKGATLTVAPGTRLLFHEFAALTVQGSLRLLGTAEQPITLESNEAHPSNQQWGGVIFLPGSDGIVTYTTVSYGLPAITCYKESVVDITHSTLTATEVGALVYSPQCSITQSVINSTNIGIMAIDSTPTLTETVITAGKEAVKTVSAATLIPSTAH